LLLARFMEMYGLACSDIQAFASRGCTTVLGGGELPTSAPTSMPATDRVSTILEGAPDNLGKDLPWKKLSNGKGNTWWAIS
jgi:hypothetical protein